MTMKWPARRSANAERRETIADEETTQPRFRQHSDERVRALAFTTVSLQVRRSSMYAQCTGGAATRQRKVQRQSSEVIDLHRVDTASARRPSRRRRRRSSSSSHPVNRGSRQGKVERRDGLRQLAARANEGE